MVLKLRHVAVGLLACLGLCGCFPTAESQSDEQKNPYYLAGKERVASRDYKGAIEAFEKALEVNPRSALAHFELGVLYEQREYDYAAAIHHYNQVLKLRPRGEYPAEHAKLRIPACKLEMIKTDTLTTINPAALQELERLREDNQQLRKQVEYLQLQLQSRPASASQSAPPPGLPAPGLSAAGRAGSTGLRGSPTNAASSASGIGAKPAAASGRTPPTGVRAHKVKERDTLTSIARQYGVRLESLMAANPGLDARRLKVGQTINVPSS